MQFFLEYWAKGPNTENCITLISLIGLRPMAIGKMRVNTSRERAPRRPSYYPKAPALKTFFKMKFFSGRCRLLKNQAMVRAIKTNSKMTSPSTKTVPAINHPHPSVEGAPNSGFLAGQTRMISPFEGCNWSGQTG